MKKILFIIPSLTQTNGISSFLINYLANMNLDGFEISILSSNLRPSNEHVRFLKEKNITLYYFDDLRENGIVRYTKSIKSFFKIHHDFDLIYSNVANQSLIIFNIAKRYNIHNFAIHSHATVSSASKYKRIINNILIKIILHKTQHLYSCSRSAGKAMFKDKEFVVINNAIDYSRYKFNVTDRIETRQSLNIKDEEKIIGYVGRFAPQKNIFFFKKLAKVIKENYKIIMIGTGEQKQQFISEVREEGLDNKFIFIEESAKINKYYSAMDFFVLPSHYEGLPVVAIEAQANGLKCLLSDTISEEAKILASTKFLNRDDVEAWKEELEKSNAIREENVEYKIDDKFNIRIQAQKFEDELKRIV